MAKDVILHVIGDIGFRRRDLPCDAVGRRRRAIAVHGRPHDHREHGDRSRRQKRRFSLRRKDRRLRATNAHAERHEERITRPSSDRSRSPSSTTRRSIFRSSSPPSRAIPIPASAKKRRTWASVSLDRAYVGSCTGGKTSDFLAFAHVVKGRRVKIDTFGVPATPEIVRDLQTTYWGGNRLEILEGRRADDGERLVRRVPRRAGGHVRPHEQGDELHQRDEPEFPRPHGQQGIESFPRLADDRGRERDRGEDC
jgi:3-isopropylmalate/(R)-2-methylmalate dehydratase large subunit